MLRKQFIVVIVFLCTIYINPTSAYSQDYKGAVGGRFGFGIGLTGVYQIQNGHCLEFLLRYGYHGLILNKPGVNFQLLYEKHWGLGRSNFTAYIGGGPAFGFGKKRSQDKIIYFATGISPIVGFDYTTQRLRLPIILSLDYKPTFNADVALNSKNKVGTDFSYYEVAFSVRIGIGRQR